MEPIGGQMTQVRYKLIIGKFPVTRVGPIEGVFKIAIALPGATLIFTAPKTADVREGDLLTMYTEVLADVKPSQSSIQ